MEYVGQINGKKHSASGQVLLDITSMENYDLDLFIDTHIVQYGQGQF